MVFSPLPSRNGPKLYPMLFFVVVITFAFYVFTGRSAPVQTDDYSLGSVFLEESYLLYFEPVSDKDAEQTLAKRKKYSSQYESIIAYGLDGDLNQHYDTLLIGFSFSLSYTEKVMKAIGLKDIPNDVETSTFTRLQDFLESYAGEDMAKDNVRMILEKDGSMSIQS